MYIESLLPAYSYLARLTGQEIWQDLFDQGNGYAVGFWAEPHGDSHWATGLCSTSVLRKFRQAADSWEAEALKVARRLYRQDDDFRSTWQGPYRKL